MASEKRLIDAYALRNRMFDYYGCVNEYTSKSTYTGETLMDYEVADMIENCIDNAPTVDAVEVVRCKDCKRWKYDARKLCGFCDALICYRPDYFWCMYGERRIDEVN